MSSLRRATKRLILQLILGLTLTAALFSQSPLVPLPIPENGDAAAIMLARKYLKGGEDSRAALLDALQRMGWGVRNAKGEVVVAAPKSGDTGLAMRDYELEELLWHPSEQPTIRLISVAQALAVPFEDADPEELAQDLVESLRRSAESSQPQQRFWAQFIIALGRVSPANYDLATPAPAPVMQASPARLQAMMLKTNGDPYAMAEAMKPLPVWDRNDPVLAPSPHPKNPSKRADSNARDKKRLEEINAEISRFAETIGQQKDPAAQAATQARMTKLMTEMNAISQRQQAAVMSQLSEAKSNSDEDADEDSDSAEKPSGRFLAEWRDQPLSLLQISLITRVLAADIRQAVARGSNAPTKNAQFSAAAAHLPFAMIHIAQAGGPPTSLGGQFSGAMGDIWATASGAYTSAVLEHNLPNSKFTKGTAIANTIIAWYKTIMSVARQKITIKVENVPLVRTKTRTPGEQRTARATVEIDFPKSDVLKAIRAAGNLATIDLQMPDGGPVSGAKVVWRLPEGSYNTKYQTAKGGWAYKPELAVVEFAQAGGPAAYISYTNDAGEATITIEGTAQRKMLSPTVRPYPRRAAIAVEVTIKVGNLTQDFNDAINTAMGGPITGALGFIADMVLRTSFFFQKSEVFEVTDWKEPAWEGEFNITVKGSGSKHEEGEKGGPPADYEWRMNRYMEGRLHTPDWEEEVEQTKEYTNDGRHTLEVDGDSRYFRLDDSSHAKSRSFDNRYEASGPMQIQPAGQNQLELYSRSEPSGSASLVFNGGFMQLDLQPFFGAECIVGRSESAHGRSSSKAGPEYLSLLNGVNPDSFTIIEQNDGKADYIEGTKTIDGTGNLPFVPSFDVTIVVKYRLWKNGPPPKNKPR